MLQAGSFLVCFPMVSLEIFIDNIPIHTIALVYLQLLTEMCTSNILWEVKPDGAWD